MNYAKKYMEHVVDMRSIGLKPMSLWSYMRWKLHIGGKEVHDKAIEVMTDAGWEPGLSQCGGVAYVPGEDHE